MVPSAFTTTAVAVARVNARFALMSDAETSWRLCRWNRTTAGALVPRDHDQIAVRGIVADGYSQKTRPLLTPCPNASGHAIGMGVVRTGIVTAGGGAGGFGAGFGFVFRLAARGPDRAEDERRDRACGKVQGHRPSVYPPGAERERRNRHRDADAQRDIRRR